MSTRADRRDSAFVKLLQAQVSNEFAAHQQYIAVAVWFDAHDLPQLAGLFYRQAVEERNHAMMMVQYLLDRDIAPVIPGIGDVVNSFDEPVQLIELALRQEEQVTDQIEALAQAARDDGDFLGEQFVLWFLKEQVEEVSSMDTLLTIVRRAADDYFKIEEFVARENAGAEVADPGAPRAAGIAL